MLLLRGDVVTALMCRLADLAWSVAARILNWLLGPPQPPSPVPDFVPDEWVAENAEWLTGWWDL